jgi:hypothetical protein
MAFIRLHALFDLSLKLTLQFVSSHLLFLQYQQLMFYYKIQNGFRYIPWQSVLFVCRWTIPDRNMQGVLLSNETVQITVRAYIDNAMASILNQGPKDLSATLILHTVLGKDHFISVSGEYS